ncbi:lymphocyte antigen 6K [Arvicanthis niloticus]|uniref:lymphocyte antigen 6K n=1 Tax=Arvicanthis niloticus TaxID=61156 RepID=UPI00148733EF|nr:lymphocyte antigen 6K [Arvicanthis niloticus]
MVILLALLIVMGLPLVQTDGSIKCHLCEAENSFNCSNPTDCPNEDQFCVLAATRIFERFFYVSKQCSRVCSTPVITHPTGSELAEPKEFLMEKPMPFLYVSCCKWNLCNDKGPPSIQLFKEQPGKASERRHRYTELLLPGFMVLIANGLSALSLL